MYSIVLGLVLLIAGVVFTWVIPTGRFWYGAIIVGVYFGARGIWRSAQAPRG